MPTGTRNLNIEQLEAIAANILTLKQRVRARRPIVLEFCGSPKAGKTSCISSLNIFLKRNGFKTQLLSERAGVCPISDKMNPLFNVWTSCSAIAELAHHLAEGSRDYDVIMSDRGIFDALCWFRWLKDHKHLDPADYSAMEGFLTAKRWRTCLDLVYVFTSTPETSMEREYATLLTRKFGSIMNASVLRSYRNAIDETVANLGHMFRRVETIDTTSLDQNAVSHRVTTNVLESLLDLIMEQVGYVRGKELTVPEGNVAFRFSESGLKDGSLRFSRRDQVERDPGAVQPIPIAVICNHDRSEVLILKKSKAGTSEGSPEAERYLAYAGGHVRREDQLDGESEPLLVTLAAALSREIQEELGVSLRFDVTAR